MVQVTRHGIERSRERAGVPKRAVERMAHKALTTGRYHGEFAGSFRHYLDGLLVSHPGKGNNLRIYSNHIFVFADDTLITVLPVRGQFRKLIERKA